MESRDEYYRRRLAEFYKGSVPDYIVGAGKTHLTIRVQEDLFNVRDYVVTICSVTEFLSSEDSGLEEEELAGIRGDPQFLYNLAMECMQWFKFIDPEGFK